MLEAVRALVEKLHLQLGVGGLAVVVDELRQGLGPVRAASTGSQADLNGREDGALWV
jgi:hypothetical protein